MELQFVFGNPGKKGKKASILNEGKKPLHKSKGKGKLKSGIERSTTMAKKKKVRKNSKPAAKRVVAKKPTKRTKRKAKNPVQYYVDTGKKEKGLAGLRGKTKLQTVSLPIPTQAEINRMKAMVTRARSFETKARLTKTDLNEAAKIAEALGMTQQAAELRKKAKSDLHGLDTSELFDEIKESGILRKIGLVKKYVSDIERNGPRIKEALKRAASSSRKGLKSKFYETTLPESDDIELNDDETRRGLPSSFYDALSKYYSRSTEGVSKMKKRKTKKARNPVVALDGVEAYQEANPRKKKKAKKSVKKAHKRRKSTKAGFTFTMSKGVAKKARKLKKGKTLRVKGGIRVRRNPMLPSIPALRQFLGLDLQPMAMLAVAAASTGVVNGLVRFGLNKAKLGDKLSGTVARNLVPSIGPMAFAVLLNVLGDKMRKPILRELGEAFATVGIVSLGVNTLGGAVTRLAGTLPGMKGALAGYDASIGLLPEGMMGMGDDADFGSDDADFGAEGIGSDDADFGGVENFNGVSHFEGVESFSGVESFNGIPEGMGEDDADFGEDDADFGEGDAIG